MASTNATGRRVRPLVCPSCKGSVAPTDLNATGRTGLYAGAYDAWEVTHRPCGKTWLSAHPYAAEAYGRRS